MFRLPFAPTRSMNGVLQNGADERTHHHDERRSHHRRRNRRRYATGCRCYATGRRCCAFARQGDHQGQPEEGRAQGQNGREGRRQREDGSWPTGRKRPLSRPRPAAKVRKPEARDGSKKSAVIELLRRKEGATAAEIAKVTKWQAHSIRGFISGTISKKMKLAVESVRNEQGERVYKVK